MDKLEVVARAHVTLHDDGLYARLEVLNGEHLQVEHSPVALTPHAPAQAEIDRLRGALQSLSSASAQALNAIMGGKATRAQVRDLLAGPLDQSIAALQEPDQ